MRLVTSLVAASLCLSGIESPSARGAQPDTPAPSRAPRNADEFDTLFQQLKNWGRWLKMEWS